MTVGIRKKMLNGWYYSRLTGPKSCLFQAESFYEQGRHSLKFESLLAEDKIKHALSRQNI